MNQVNYNSVFESLFEVKGFFLEIFINNQFQGSIPCQYTPGRNTGYTGREIITLECDITTSTKKRLKKGTIVTTYYFPICGKSVDKVFEK